MSDEKTGQEEELEVVQPSSAEEQPDELEQQAPEVNEPTAEVAPEVTEETTSDSSEPEPVAEVAADAESTGAETVSEAEPTEAETSDDADAEEAESVDDTAETTAETVVTEAESETAPEPTAEAEPEAEDDSGLPRRGDLLHGTITRTSPTSVEVDLGEGLVGMVPGGELERMTRQNIESLVPGTEVDVYVVNPRDHNGNILLSINRALEELDWQRAEEFRRSQEVFEGTVAGYNKGGLIVRFGRLRGFVPQSQITDTRRQTVGGEETPEDRYSAMVNDNIAVKVMEVDRGRNRLILSERAAARVHREQRKAELISELGVGQVIMGRVVSLEDFGAFVDVGGAEGLVHLTEIAWKHVTHPREILKEGQEVKVEVISIDPDRKRIGLSIKRQAADPWDEVATTYQVGDLVQGTITKSTKFGAFARLVDAEEIEGLIHISELSEERVSHPREVVNVGEKLTLRVVKIDVKNRRLGLSLKRVNSAEYLDRDLKTFASNSDDEG